MGGSVTRVVGSSNSSRSTTPSIRILSASGICPPSTLDIRRAMRRTCNRGSSAPPKAFSMTRELTGCLVLCDRSCVDGHLYELDGRKKFPINHGPSSQDTLLKVRLQSDFESVSITADDTLNSAKTCFAVCLSTGRVPRHPAVHGARRRRGALYDPRVGQDARGRVKSSRTKSYRYVSKVTAIVGRLEGWHKAFALRKRTLEQAHHRCKLTV